MDFHSYPLAERSTSYDEQVSKHVAKRASRPQNQMKSQLFDQMDLISIIGFLQAFKIACDNNEAHKGATM